MCVTYIDNYHFSERLQDMIQKALIKKLHLLFIFCENDFFLTNIFPIEVIKISQCFQGNTTYRRAPHLPKN